MNNDIKRAVVLGGGGTKGAYEAGVWQALDELGVAYHVVVGTSIGAMTGAMMAQGALQETLHLWRTADNQSMMKDVPTGSDVAELYHAFAKQIIAKGGIDISPMEERLRSMVNEDVIRKSPIEYGLVTVDMRNLKAVELFVKDIPKGKLHDFILASATCFPAFKPRDIDGVIYVDGGYRNNIPISLALKAEQQVDEIIAVDVNGIGYSKTIQTDLPIRYICSYWGLGNMLVFNNVTACRNLTLGYNDAMKAFGHYEGQAYTFKKGELQLFYKQYMGEFSRIFLNSINLFTSYEKTVMQDILSRRIMDTACNKRGETDKYDLYDFLLTLCELAAELLDIDPTNVYTMQDFNKKILVNYNILADESKKIAPILFGDQKGDWIAAVKSLKVEQLLVGARQVVHIGISGLQPVPLPLLVTLFPKEFMAALYIEMIWREDLYLI